MIELRISSAAVIKNVVNEDGKIVKGGGWFQAHRIMLFLAALVGMVGFILIFVDHKVSQKIQIASLLYLSSLFFIGFCQKSRQHSSCSSWHYRHSVFNNQSDHGDITSRSRCTQEKIFQFFPLSGWIFGANNGFCCVVPWIGNLRLGRYV